MEPLSPEVRLFGRMVAFVQRVQREAEAALAGQPVSPAQFFLLMALERHGALPQARLAEMLGVTPANVSQLLAKLAGAGLVARAERGTTRRVSLTEAGRAVVTGFRPAHDAFLRDRFAALTAEERDRLLDLLARLLGGGDEGCGEGEAPAPANR